MDLKDTNTKKCTQGLRRPFGVAGRMRYVINFCWCEHLVSLDFKDYFFAPSLCQLCSLDSLPNSPLVTTFLVTKLKYLVSETRFMRSTVNNAILGLERGIGSITPSERLAPLLPRTEKKGEQYRQDLITRAASFLKKISRTGNAVTQNESPIMHLDSG